MSSLLQVIREMSEVYARTLHGSVTVFNQVSSLVPQRARLTALYHLIISRKMTAFALFHLQQRSMAMSLDGHITDLIDLLKSWQLVFLKVLKRCKVGSLTTVQNSATRCKIAKLLMETPKRVGNNSNSLSRRGYSTSGPERPVNMFPAFAKVIATTPGIPLTVDNSILNESVIQHALNILTDYSENYAILHDAFIVNVDDESNNIVMDSFDICAAKGSPCEHADPSAINQKIKVCELQSDDNEMDAHSMMVSHEVHGVAFMKIFQRLPVQYLAETAMPALEDIFSRLFFLGQKYTFVHNDLHTSNVLFNPEHGRAVVIDFGRSTFLNEQRIKAAEPERYRQIVQFMKLQQQKLDTDMYQKGIQSTECHEYGENDFQYFDDLRSMYARMCGKAISPHVAHAGNFDPQMAPFIALWDIGRFCVEAFKDISSSSSKDDPDWKAVTRIFVPNAAASTDRAAVLHVPADFDATLRSVDQLRSSGNRFLPLCRGLLWLAYVASWCSTVQSDNGTPIFRNVMNSYVPSRCRPGFVADFQARIQDASQPFVHLVMPWTLPPSSPMQGGGDERSDARQVWESLTDPFSSARIEYGNDEDDFGYNGIYNRFAEYGREVFVEQEQEPAEAALREPWMMSRVRQDRPSPAAVLAYGGGGPKKKSKKKSSP
jgi:hypothetical protein